MHSFTVSSFVKLERLPIISNTVLIKFHIFAYKHRFEKRPRYFSRATFDGIPNHVINVKFLSRTKNTQTDRTNAEFNGRSVYFELIRGFLENSRFLRVIRVPGSLRSFEHPGKTYFLQKYVLEPIMAATRPVFMFRSTNVFDPWSSKKSSNYNLNNLRGLWRVHFAVLRETLRSIRSILNWSFMYYFINIYKMIAKIYS